MKQFIVTVMALLISGSTVICHAQKKKDLGEPVFQEASAREDSPAIGVIVIPELADLEMINTSRESYGPYEYSLVKDVNAMTAAELETAKSIALQKAAIEAGADVIIEPLYTSTVYDKDSKTLWVQLSGYPAKYVNFRKMTNADIELVKVLYPNGGIIRRAEHIITTAHNESK